MHLGRVTTLDLKVIRLEHLRRPNDILDYDEEGMNGAEEKMAGIQVSDLNAAARKYRLIDFSS